MMMHQLVIIYSQRVDIYFIGQINCYKRQEYIIIQCYITVCT